MDIVSVAFLHKALGPIFIKFVRGA